MVSNNELEVLILPFFFDRFLYQKDTGAYKQYRDLVGRLRTAKNVEVKLEPESVDVPKGKKTFYHFVWT